MRAGFVGLGAMGMHMARNLHRAGLLTAVWNRTAEKARTFRAQLNVQVTPDLEPLALRGDALVPCVSADADVLAVVEALAKGVRSDAVVIDCSTVGAET